jgi:phage terminase large subunit-like protein
MLNEALKQLLGQLKTDWRSTARPEQLMPPGNNWTIWLYLGGRGTGKTKSGAEAVREEVDSGRCRRVALIAPTASDARKVMLEGPAGLLTIYPEAQEPLYQYHPTRREIRFRNGAIASLYSAEEPDRLRGPQHDLIWADELAAWPDAQQVWDMAMFGLRVGKHPRAIITTTPRPIPIIKSLISRNGKDVVVTRGRTLDNIANLPPVYVNQIIARYQGTRLGRQELDAEILDDVPGAFWSREMIDAARKPVGLPDMARVVVAVDPSGTKGAKGLGDEGDDGDWIGIVIVGKGVDGRGYVLADRTCKLSPAGWGRRAVDAYHEFKADRIVAERNFGGAMVEHVIRSVDPGVAYKEVSASRGKAQRAEPIAALYEQGRVSHIGDLALLEDQLCQFSAEGYAGKGSPDRADALIWGLAEILGNQNSTLGFLNFYAAEATGAIGAGPVPGVSQFGRTVRLLIPPGVGAVRLASGEDLSLWNAQVLEVTPDDARSLLAAGWSRAPAST